MFFFLLTGCENKEEILKNKYIDIKNHLLDNKKYMNSDELPLDIMFDVDRIDEENVKLKIIFSNPSENMREIRAMAIHNYYEEELFPTIGVFDEKKELLLDSDNELVLKSNIKTTKNVSKLDLQFNVWFEYKNDSGELKEIFYKTT